MNEGPVSNSRSSLRPENAADSLSRAAEDRVVDELKRRGLVLADAGRRNDKGRALRRWLRYGAVAAAVVAAFLAGIKVGGRVSAEAPSSPEVLPAERRGPYPQALPAEAIPGEILLTAFHVEREHPLDRELALREEQATNLLEKTIGY